MAYLDRFPRCDGDRRAGINHLPGAVSIELHAELRRIGEHVVAAAVGDIDLDVAEPWHVQRYIECLDERRNAVERHPFASTVATGRRDADQAGRGFQYN